LRHIRRLVLLVVIAAACTFVGLPGTSSGAPQWAPAATAAIHPGVQTFTAGAQCTANFVFTDGTTVYIGQAAHCSGTGAATETDGCDSASLPLGTPVEVTGATRPGTLVYNSWIRMQQQHETDPDTCAYNDFALIQLDPADVALVNPSVPFFGGPTAVGAPTNVGDKVYSYGNSSLRFGITQLSPKYGISLGNTAGWSTKTYTLTPGIPGDSGSGFLNAQGRAIGVLSTVELAPMPAANNFGDLGKELAYMHQQAAFAAVQLAPGTEAFRVPLTPLGG
jgi:hypothetical protein